MQAFTIVAVLLLASGLASASDQRLSDDCLRGITHRDKCCEGVPDAWYAHLRNPEDCASFYQCEHGKPTWKACAEGTHWSVEADRCEWPHEAKCTVDPKPNPEPTTDNSLPSTTIQGSTGSGPKLPAGCYDGSIDAKTCCVGVSDFWVHLPDPANCGKFYQCDNGKAVHKDCPAGLHWSVAEDKCEWPDKAGCAGTTKPPPNTSSLPTTTSQPPSTQTQPPPPTSSSSATTPTTRPPPTDTTTANPPPTTTNAPPTTPIPDDGDDDKCAPEPVCHQCIIGIFPADLCCRDVKTYHKLQLANGNDCSSYYQCVDGKAIQRDCPSGLHWSIQSERCEWPVAAQCVDRDDNNSTDSTTTPKPDDTTSGDHVVSSDCLYGKVSAEECCKGVPYWVDVLLQNNADCHTFIQCVHEKPMVRPCAANLRWSVTKNRCEWQENATCTW